MMWIPENKNVEWAKYCTQELGVSIVRVTLPATALTNSCNFYRTTPVLTVNRVDVAVENGESSSEDRSHVKCFSGINHGWWN